MITIQAGELAGMIKDVLGYACPDKAAEFARGIRLYWDGEMLHAEAADPIRGIAARSSWHPDDEPDENIAESARWGSTDEPWISLIHLDDAKYLTKVFKPAAKDRGIPLRVTHGLHREIRIVRDADTGATHADHTITYADIEIPEMPILDDDVKANEPIATRCGPLGFRALGQVRTRGEAVIGTTLSGKALRVDMGQRFRSAYLRSDSRQPAEIPAE